MMNTMERPGRTLLALGLGFFLIALACESPTSTGADAEPPVVEAAAAAASAPAEKPLYFVDGVRVGVEPSGRLELDPNDIESIEVIKGGAATRLYGSRGASGVIRITTKR